MESHHRLDWIGSNTLPNQHVKRRSHRVPDWSEAFVARQFVRDPGPCSTSPRSRLFGPAIHLTHGYIVPGTPSTWRRAYQYRRASGRGTNRHSRWRLATIVRPRDDRLACAPARLSTSNQSHRGNVALANAALVHANDPAQCGTESPRREFRPKPTASIRP